MLARLALLILLGVVGTSFALKGQVTSYCSFPPCCDSNPSPGYTEAEKKTCRGNECEDYHGCDYQGELAYCGKKSHSWVIKNNITALYSTHWDTAKYKNKRIRVTQGSKRIDAVVCESSDDDCEDCCTKNAGSSGYLIDMEWSQTRSNDLEVLTVKSLGVVWIVNFCE